MDYCLLGLIVLYVGLVIYASFDIQANTLLRKELLKDREIFKGRLAYLKDAEEKFSKAQEQHHEQVTNAYKTINNHQERSQDEWVVQLKKPKKKQTRKKIK